MVQQGEFPVLANSVAGFLKTSMHLGFLPI